jgi:sporulation protein YtfJ
MNTEEILKTVTEKVASMISTKTVIGESMTIDGRTIIPVTRVSFGFGSGGGEGKAKSGDVGTGSGGGAGAMIQPIGFLVVSKEDVKLFSIQGKDVVSRLAEVIPQIMEKYKSVREEHRKEEPSMT